MKYKRTKTIKIYNKIDNKSILIKINSKNNILSISEDSKLIKYKRFVYLNGWLTFNKPLLSRGSGMYKNMPKYDFNNSDYINDYIADKIQNIEDIGSSERSNTIRRTINKEGKIKKPYIIIAIGENIFKGGFIRFINSQSNYTIRGL